MIACTILPLAALAQLVPSIAPAPSGVMYQTEPVSGYVPLMWVIVHSGAAMLSLMYVDWERESLTIGKP